MVKIFADASGTGEFVIQTTATDADVFVSQLAEAMFKATKDADDGGLSMLSIMKNAMPIAFKLSGYKADNVMEQRTLVCGSIDPMKCEFVASAGR